MKSPEHQQLLAVLNKLVTQEKWQWAPKSNGKILNKSMTKNGNVKLVLQTAKGDKTVYVLKRNSNLFETASQIAVGDTISVTLRRYLGKLYCVKLVKK